MYFSRKSQLYCKYAVVTIVVMFTLTACGRKSPSQEIVIKINDYTLTSKEFNELFAEAGFTEDTPDAREAFIQNLVSRKLLLQEAQNENMDKQKVFLKKIENFWEQALLQIIIDMKAKKIVEGLHVSEQELQTYYDEWTRTNPDNTESFDDLREVIKWQLLRRKRYLTINAWIVNLKSKAEIAIDRKAIGIK